MLKAIARGIEYAVKHLAFLLFVAMIISVFGQVVMRYVFGDSVFWAEEFSRYAMIWICFLGASMGVKDGSHTQIDFFINHLPKNIKKWIQIFNKSICIVFLAFISYYVVAALSYTMGTLSPAMRIPIGLVHLALPISGAVMAIHLLLDIYRLLHNKPLPSDELLAQ